MIKVDRDTLYNLYIGKGMPMHEIASTLGIAIGTVYNYLKKYNIQTRKWRECFELKKANGWNYPDEARAKISKAHKGKIVSEETRRKMSESKRINGSGHIKKRADGYNAVYFPSHPSSNQDGYVMEHVLVMEKAIGRILEDDEVVHHENGIRNDNRIENLKLMTFKEHARYHMKQRWESKKKGGMTYQQGNFIRKSS